MIPKPYLIGGAIVGFALWTAGVWWIADGHGFDRCRVKEQAATLEAVKNARKEEQEKQEKVNATLQTQNDELAAINTRLATDNQRLQQRASRRHMPRDTKTDCKGAIGSELSREDAAFLIRLAAQCQRQQVAKESCYEYADTVGTKDD